MADKLRLAGLADGGRVIANFRNKALVERLAQNPDVTWFNKDGTWQACENGIVGNNGIQVSATVSLPGEHNIQNLAAAMSVVDELGLKINDIDEALSTFTGLPHRLQLIGEKEGIRYVDDSISTTPVSVAVALQTIGNQDVVLLLGGMDRGLDWSDFANKLAGRTPHAIVILPDNGRKIFDCLKSADVEPEGGLHHSAQLEEAVELARRLVPAKGCILLSPGAPSFPHFRDFEDRGNQFKKYAAIEKSSSSAH